MSSTLISDEEWLDSFLDGGVDLLSRMPRPVLVEVVLQLDSPADVCNLSRTCRLFRDICADTLVWEKHCRTTFGIRRHEGESWREMFSRCSRFVRGMSFPRRSEVSLREASRCDILAANSRFVVARLFDEVSDFVDFFRLDKLKQRSLSLELTPERERWPSFACLEGSVLAVASHLSAKVYDLDLVSHVATVRTRNSRSTNFITSLCYEPVSGSVFAGFNNGSVRHWCLLSGSESTSVKETDFRSWKAHLSGSVISVGILCVRDDFPLVVDLVTIGACDHSISIWKCCTKIGGNGVSKVRTITVDVGDLSCAEVGAENSRIKDGIPPVAILANSTSVTFVPLREGDLRKPVQFVREGTSKDRLRNGDRKSIQVTIRGSLAAVLCEAQATIYDTLTIQPIAVISDAEAIGLFAPFVLVASGTSVRIFGTSPFHEVTSLTSPITDEGGEKFVGVSGNGDGVVFIGSRALIHWEVSGDGLRWLSEPPMKRAQHLGNV